MRFMPYLNFDGNAAEAMRFYQGILGGELELSPFGESPMADEVPADMKDRLMHAELRVGDQVLMSSDAPRVFRPAGLVLAGPGSGEAVSLHTAPPVPLASPWSGNFVKRHSKVAFAHENARFRLRRPSFTGADSTQSG